MKDVKSQNEFRDNLPVSIFRCSILDRAQAYKELSTLVWFFRHKSPSLRWGTLPVFVYIRFHKSPNTAKQVEKDSSVKVAHILGAVVQHLPKVATVKVF